MVHRLTHQDQGDGSAAATEGVKRETTSTRRRRRRQGGGDAIAAIKRKMLRCSSEAGERGRFKRSYLAGGGEQGDGASAVFFYLACIACAPA
ncbi:hypothetical protein D1007_38341 [Hordeum vulgare]|nr:hypothetical protein D1007_38341 [Hordeum vulgare]KAI4966699.1 hypothetical protein ZWY2020_037055 [Hordeum vulgare]KAI4972563.1 hypothetical protein ZWY2020_003488 [Hordeum vulgare]